jgi:hypothetical protein
MRLFALFLLVNMAALQLHAREQCDDEIARLAKQADTVVEAVVLDPGQAPGFWSGQLEARQRVTFRLTLVLKGSFKQSEFNVEYLVVHGSRLSERKSPELSHALFGKGSELILILHARDVTLPSGRTYLLVDAAPDDCSVLRASPATIARAKDSAK